MCDINQVWWVIIPLLCVYLGFLHHDIWWFEGAAASFVGHSVILYEGVILGYTHENQS
jgi:hypothetical protein